jgi:hypothetical protein
MSKKHDLAILAHSKVFQNGRKIWRSEVHTVISAQPIRADEADDYEPAQK